MQTNIIQVTLILFAACYYCPISSAQVDYEKLRDRAYKSVESGEIKVDEPEFKETGDSISYHIDVVTDIDTQQPFAIPFSEMLRVAAIKKHRMKTSAGRQFWRPVLREVENNIEEMMKLSNNKNLPKEQIDIQLGELQERIQNVYEKRIHDWAESQGKEAVQIKNAPASFSLSYQAEPSDCELRYMTKGDYDLYRWTHNEQTPPWDHDGWNSWGTGEDAYLSYNTVFWARWTTGPDRIVAKATTGTKLIVDQKRGLKWINEN
jgi:hypothetical protein